MCACAACAAGAIGAAADSAENGQRRHTVKHERSCVGLLALRFTALLGLVPLLGVGNRQPHDVWHPEVLQPVKLQCETVVESTSRSGALLPVPSMPVKLGIVWYGLVRFDWVWCAFADSKRSLTSLVCRLAHWQLDENG